MPCIRVVRSSYHLNMKHFYNRIASRLRMHWCTLKRYFATYRVHFVLCLAFALIGLLSALSRTYDGHYYNFMAAIAGGDRSPVGMFLRIAGFTSLTYFFVFATSFHFGFFIVGYGGIAVGSMLLFRGCFASVVADGVWGILCLLLFILPVFLFDLISVILCLIKVYDFRGYAVNRRCFINLACNSRKLLKEVVDYYCASLIFTFALWLLWYLLLLLILKSA